MNIKILDSWLRDYLKTKASAKEVSQALSLTSLSVEKLEKTGDDYIYEMEITTNRPDLFSVTGIAREAAAVLPRFGISAEFVKPQFEAPRVSGSFPIEIKINPKLVNRVSAVVMEVKIGQSSELIKKRLEASGIRSLNNVIDVTNYVMRVIGHPCHVFDFDRLNTKTLTIEEARVGEKIKTLDEKTYLLKGGEIVARDGNGRIVDLLGIMGLANSVVTNGTMRILYFLDNNKPSFIRRASMNLAVRTEAAVLNEKGIDAELVKDALFYGIGLFEKSASGKVISSIFDQYPNKPKEMEISLPFEKIRRVLGSDIKAEDIGKILSSLAFKVKLEKEQVVVRVPSFRIKDIEIEEDVIEEIARVYGYDNLPTHVPKIAGIEIPIFYDDFYFENKAKNALKYWGFTECYTYSFVSEDMYEGPINEALQIANPLNNDLVYMRNSLIPSLLNVVRENKSRDEIKIFELSNTYKKNDGKLPYEVRMLSAVVKSKTTNFYEIKGVVEQLSKDLGIEKLVFKNSEKGGLGASVYIGKKHLGEIEVLDGALINFEINFEVMLRFANVKKVFKHFSKFPPITEDISIISDTNTQDLINAIASVSSKIAEVALLDSYKASRTFHIVYLDYEKNLTKEDVAKIRKEVLKTLKEKYKVEIRG